MLPMSVDRNTVQETGQRSATQFSLFSTNLMANGAIVAFGLKPPGEFSHALLLAPIVSFVLFSLWVHNAIVIRSIRASTAATHRSRWWVVRTLTFSIAMLSNFVLFPMGAMLLHDGSAYSAIRTLDIVLLTVAAGLYILWFYVQYLTSRRLE
jgi:hypothetical protein